MCIVMVRKLVFWESNFLFKSPKKSTVYNSQNYDMHSRAYDDYSGSIATNTLQYSHDSAIPRAKIENHYEDIYSDHKKSAIFT